MTSKIAKAKAKEKEHVVETMNKSPISLTAYKDIIDAYYREGDREKKIGHLLDSYNQFYDISIKRIIENKNPQVVQIELPADSNIIIDKQKAKYVKSTVMFKNIVFHKPNYTDGLSKQNIPLLPNMCRNKNLNYFADVMVDTAHKVEFLSGSLKLLGEPNLSTNNGVKLCAIPVMLHSKLCHLNGLTEDALTLRAQEELYGLGGYFIVNGGEKALISQEKKISNHVTLYLNNKGKYPYVCEIKCTQDDTYGSPATATVKMDNSGVIFFSLQPGFAENVNIPITVMFKALGVPDDLSIMQYAVYDMNNQELTNIMRPSINYKLGKVEQRTQETPAGKVAIGSKMQSKGGESSTQELTTEAQETPGSAGGSVGGDETEEVEHEYIIRTQGDALEYIADKIRAQSKGRTMFETKHIGANDHEKKIEYIRYVFSKYLFPHLKLNFVRTSGVLSDAFNDRKKAYFLGYMCNKLIKGKLGIVPEDNRDNYALKRVSTAGILLSQLFYQCFGKYVQSITDSIKKEIQGTKPRQQEIEGMLTKIMTHKKTFIESFLKRALLVGEWSIMSRGVSEKQGVAQTAQRATPTTMLSTLRRIVTPQGKNQKNKPEIRRLNTTTFGIKCTVETPEGGNIGMVCHMAMFCTITITASPDYVYTILRASKDIIDISNTSPTTMIDVTKIFINGEWVGITSKPRELVNVLRDQRRAGAINYTISIVHDDLLQEIRIYSDAGRCMFPVYIVDPGNKLRITDEIIAKVREGKMQWTDLIRNGYIEYLEVQEAMYSTLIAMYPSDLTNPDNRLKRYTHCVIHPTMILGLVASMCPFSDHNQSPRNLFYTAQAKQALSVYSTNYRNRMDATGGHIMWYPEIPLVKTIMSEYCKYDEIPAGTNCIVAIMTKEGFGQEDAMIINKSAVDRGLFIATLMSIVKDELKANKTYRKPNQVETQNYKRNQDYSKLEQSGYPKLNAKIERNDVLIGKVKKLDAHEQYGKNLYKDISIQSKFQTCFVDKIVDGQNQDGNSFVKVRVRMEKIPEVGDKFVSRHAQKGTVGMAFSDEDMPFTESGIKPDIIMNPHGIPSRMTMGQEIECVSAKIASIKGINIDATPFNNIDVYDFPKILGALGFNSYGYETMYCPYSGEKIKAQIFIGPTYYQRLKHIVSEKIHARAIGAIQMSTHQPLEGRAQEGGQRFGEMESWVQWSHGQSSFLQERFMPCSDAVDCWIDERSGLPAIANPEKKIFCGKSTDNYTHIKKTQIPYTSKQFLYECMACGFCPRIFLDPNTL